jgi:hypothetical protein
MGENKVTATKNKVPAPKSGHDANVSIFGGWHLFPLAPFPVLDTRVPLGLMPVLTYT